jgi:hypothetical protein
MDLEFAVGLLDRVLRVEHVVPIVLLVGGREVEVPLPPFAVFVVGWESFDALDVGELHVVLRDARVGVDISLPLFLLAAAHFSVDGLAIAVVWFRAGSQRVVGRARTFHVLPLGVQLAVGVEQGARV